MAGALQGTGTPTVYPIQQTPWAQPWGSGGISTFPGQQPFAPQQLNPIGGQSGVYVPQQLQLLQAAVQQVLQMQYIQHQHVQQLLQTLPLQLHQIQHLLQFVLQQTYQGSPWQGQPSFLPGGFPSLGPSHGLQQQLFGSQGGFGGQGYVM